MAISFAVLLFVHGVIHLLGVAKAFRLAELPQLRQPISPADGFLWLGAATLFIVTGVAVLMWPRWWWAIGLAAVVLSTAVIVPSWSDAKYGAAINLMDEVAYNVSGR